MFELPSPIVEPTPRWVRVKIGGEWVADSRRALLLIQYGPGRLPTYCFPPDDVRRDLLGPADRNGEVTQHAVTVNGETFERAAYTFAGPPAPLAALQDHLSFHWDDRTDWYEEDEQVFVHARDPHKRVDVVASTRHVQVAIHGVTVADSRRPRLLFETGLPVRYYLPSEDVRLDLLVPASLKTRCPYKGQAAYWSFKHGGKFERAIVWYYPQPIAECPKLKDLLCFFNERVDLYVDGVLQPRPQTPWSA